MLDEMAIRKQLDFDGKPLIGHCDLGHGEIDSDDLDLAIIYRILL